MRGAALCSMLLAAVPLGGCGDQPHQARTSERTAVPPQAKSPPATPIPTPAAKPSPAPAASALPSGPPPPGPGEQADADAALDVVRRYYALIDARNYREAWLLRSDREQRDLAAFEAGLVPYADYHATIGLPSRIEGAAGSLFIEVPVQLYGRLRTGKPFGTAGTLTLRRVNNVPGASAEQLHWRIYTSD